MLVKMQAQFEVMSVGILNRIGLFFCSSSLREIKVKERRGEEKRRGEERRREEKED